MRERIVALGYQEIVEIPIVDARRNELSAPRRSAPAVIGNPLAEDASVMRSTGTVSMLRALEWNLNHGQRNLRLFEIGKTYELRDGEPVETLVLTLGATGLAREKTIYEAAREFEFADLKGDLDRIGELAGGFAWQSGGPGWLAGARAAQISLAGTHSAAKQRGRGGQLARRIAEQFKLRQDVFVAELRARAAAHRLSKQRARPCVSSRCRGFPPSNAIFRWCSPMASRSRKWPRRFARSALPELQCIEAADLFRGGQVPAGKFSLMIRVKFQSAEATLTDAQLSDFSARIVAALEQKLGASLRAS